MLAQISLASGPKRAASRSFISLAALLVKVMAKICQGAAAPTAQRLSPRHCSYSVGFRGKFSRNSTSSSVIFAGISLQSLPRPKRIRLAIRLMRTVVLPEPAPASRSRGPSVVSTASCCILFSASNSPAIYFRRAVKKRCSISKVIVAHLSNIKYGTILYHFGEKVKPYLEC